jgi:hypothetical protein
MKWRRYKIMKKILAKLATIQQELKAPKNQYNEFGKYKYRNLEDIMEGVKPLLEKLKCVLTFSDEVVTDTEVMSTEFTRWHVKCTATLWDLESDESFAVSAFAREAETQKGMNDAQITGSSSSYGRKYAVQGLFLLDDSDGADPDQLPPKGKGRNRDKNQRSQEKSTKGTRSEKKDKDAPRSEEDSPLVEDVKETFGKDSGPVEFKKQFQAEIDDARKNQGKVAAELIHWGAVDRFLAKEAAEKKTSPSEIMINVAKAGIKDPEIYTRMMDGFLAWIEKEEGM